MATLQAFLQGKGYRVTPQRQAIFEVLTRFQHPSAEEILRQLRERYPMLSQATVYKTLELFEELGIVRELGFGNGASRYDTNPEPHLNLICISCKSIIDLEEDALRELDQMVRRRSHYQILQGRYEMYGICPVCQAAEGEGFES